VKPRQRALYILSLATRELFNVPTADIYKASVVASVDPSYQAGGSARTFGVVGAHLSTLSALLALSFSHCFRRRFSFSSLPFPVLPTPLFLSLGPSHFPLLILSLLVASDRSSSADTRKKCAASDGARERERSGTERGERGRESR